MNKELSFEMVIHNRTSSSIHKNRINNNNKLTTDNRQRQLDRKEMQALLAKLKQLVPGIPKNRRCSKLEIIQHVIDYIFDLQTALEQHPIASTFAATALATADFVAVNNNSSNSQSQWMPSPTSQIASCDRYLAIVQSDGHQTHSSPQRTSNRQPLASIVL